MRRWNSSCFWGFLIDYWFFWVGSVVKRKKFLQSNVQPLSQAMRGSQKNPRKSEVEIDTVLQPLHTEERWIDFHLSPPPPPLKKGFQREMNTLWLKTCPGSFRGKLPGGNFLSIRYQPAEWPLRPGFIWIPGMYVWLQNVNPFFVCQRCPSKGGRPKKTVFYRL